MVRKVGHPPVEALEEWWVEYVFGCRSLRAGARVGIVATVPPDRPSSTRAQNEEVPPVLKFSFGGVGGCE